MNIEKEIAEALLHIQAVKLDEANPFTWTSGMKTPIYTDNRLLISYPKERQTVLEGFKKVIEKNNLEFDVIGGTATAAIPWAAFLAQELGKPMVYIRPKPKGHGAGKQVEGTMAEGSKVLIVEDLISTGGSSIRSAEACQREYNATVVGVLAIFTYEFEKSKTAFAEANLPVITLTNYSSLVETAGGLNIITEDSKKILLEWSQNPSKWSQDRGGA